MGTRQLFIFDLELAINQRRTKLADCMLLLDVTLEDPLALVFGALKQRAREPLHASRDFHV